MSVSTTAENDAEDVNDFLRRIQELGNKRDQEDEERNRKLEEEILQGRRERQARRAERARSISPSKGSPLSTPPFVRSSAAIAPPNMLSPVSLRPSPEFTSPIRSPRLETEADGTMERPAGEFSPSKENIAPRNGTDLTPKRSDSIKASPSSAMPSRTPTLSWQQRRPQSQASDRSRSRPLSMLATENAARSPRATPEPSNPIEEQPPLTREQIAQSLASKDPTWFRQTADRGQNSPAFRKNQVEDDNVVDHGQTTERVQMPGMSNDLKKASERDYGTRASPISLEGLSNGSSRNLLNEMIPVAEGLGSPLPQTSAQRFDPPKAAPDLEEFESSRRTAVSPSHGLISPERLSRPASPTKGLGGFVQSAMMKRSDSVNKRWSVQSPTGLNRADSVASNRSIFDPAASARGATMSPRNQSSNLSRDSSPRPRSRADSRQSNATVTQDADRLTTSGSVSNYTTNSNLDESSDIVRPKPSSVLEEDSRARRGEVTPTRSRSPTKASGRWSPTKSSWLESALNKPDSPKPKTTASPAQPSWMFEIAKAKQRSVDGSSSSSTNGHKHTVSIGGLMRSPAMGDATKPKPIGGLDRASTQDFTARSRLKSVSDVKQNNTVEQTDNAIRKVSKSGPPLPSSAKPLVNLPTSNMRSLPSNDEGKPEAPPKKDFRANLKPRQPLPEGTGTTVPEFKNFRGQLRGSKTQNYVAPDLLKDNILRGKSELTQTGGPKKAARKDEFKDAILEKKEVFKKVQAEGKGVIRSPSSSTQSSPVPEALIKAASVRRSSTADGMVRARSASRGSPQSSPVPEALAKAALVRRSSTATKLAIATGSIEPPKPGGDTVQQTSGNGDQLAYVPVLRHETSSPARLQTSKPLNPSLAARFNPALAGLLARGPPLPGSEPSRTSSPVMATSVNDAPVSAEKEEVAPQLNHMTKARARGPKRKAPTPSTRDEAQPSQSKDDILSSEKKNDSPSLESKMEVQTPEVKTTTAKPLQNPKTIVIQPTSESARMADARKAPGPLVKPKSPFINKTSSETPVTPVEDELAQSGSPRKLDMKRRSMFLADPPAPVLVNSPKITSRSASPVKDVSSNFEKLSSPAKEHSTQILSPKTPQSPSVPFALPTASQTSRPLPVPPLKPIKSIHPSNGPNPASPRIASGPSSSTSSILRDFFGVNRAAPSYDGDTAMLLADRPNAPDQIKSLKSEILQLSHTDNRLQPIPSRMENVLFEKNMYLCTHTFETTLGDKVKEAYFWAGDDVSDAAIQDAELFCQREAKDAGATLIKIWQGKETAAFIQALGGILVTRRGSSTKYDSLAPHMLCGRRHAGQIVFDEVDFATSSLCSGFSFLVSTQNGQLYLWKGKGSNIDELSCARLIGMELGLSGEVVEIEEGSEPSSFLQAFGPAANIFKSADHWRMKPNYDRYAVRLFCIASDGTRSPKVQIKELAPFTQRSISPAKIYVLDAFFELYIIVGSQSQTQYDAFCTALSFAQEYGILAAGMEDRPFVPVSTVVLEGVPKDMKSVFRKWRMDLSPTLVNSPNTTLTRGRSLRVVTLNAALGAIGG